MSLTPPGRTPHQNAKCVPAENPANTNTSASRVPPATKPDHASATPEKDARDPRPRNRCVPASPFLRRDAGRTTAQITLDHVHQTGCPLLRRAYDIQQARLAGIHPNDLDTHLNYLWAYDQRQRLRKAKQTLTEARRAQLDADIQEFLTTHPNPNTTPARTPRRAPGRLLWAAPNDARVGEEAA